MFSSCNLQQPYNSNCKPPAICGNLAIPIVNLTQVCGDLTIPIANLLQIAATLQFRLQTSHKFAATLQSQLQTSCKLRQLCNRGCNIRKVIH
ncbi:hypothetical protein B5F77_13065 [Parabacteroides sp. An277]|nr:hypothetical protein B5F77_13065 [Parabacteroides sp. An277]